MACTGRGLCAALALAVFSLGSAAFGATQKGDSLIISLRSGKTVSGTLISETGSGFLLKTATGTQLITFGDIADIQQAGSSATPPPPPPPLAPAPTQQPVYQPPAYQQPAYQQPAYQQPAYQQPAYQQPPPGISLRNSGARVSFFAKRDRNHYTVMVGEQECDTPCSLDLEPGPKLLTTLGSGKIADSITIPSGESTIELQHQSGGVAAGLIIMSLGAGIAAIGAVLIPLVGLLPGLIIAGVGFVLAIVGVIVWAAAEKQHVKVVPSRGRSSATEAPGEAMVTLAHWGT